MCWRNPVANRDPHAVNTKKRHSLCTSTVVSVVVLVACWVALESVAGAVTTVNGVTWSRGTLLWQGFSHSWSRKVFSFLTPHRLGSFANFVTTKSSVFGGNGSGVVGNATMTFTVGVDPHEGHVALLSTRVTCNESAAPNQGVLFAEVDAVLAMSDASPVVCGGCGC